MAAVTGAQGGPMAACTLQRPLVSMCVWLAARRRLPARPGEPLPELRALRPAAEARLAALREAEAAARRAAEAASHTAASAKVATSPRRLAAGCQHRLAGC
jgi:hypothetical protein